MTRRRKGTTNRTKQEDRRLQARAVRRGTPDARKLSRAFIGLALSQAEAEAAAQAEAEALRGGDDTPVDHSEESPHDPS